MFEWLGSKSDVATTVLFCFYKPFSFLSFFTRFFSNLHTVLTITEFYRAMCVKVRGRWVWNIQLCCRNYCAICNTIKIGFVLFHLGSELWLGLPALAELKPCSCLAVAGLAVLCLYCASLGCISKTIWSVK